MTKNIESPEPWVQTSRLWQINAIAELVGLPKDTSEAEIVKALKAKANSAQANKLREQLREFVNVPDGQDPVEFAASTIGAVGNRAAADIETAKGILSNAITDGRLGPDDTRAHRVWLGRLAANRADTLPLLDSVVANRADTSQPYAARRFVARVRAEQAAGATKAQAVANAVQADPSAHVAWINAGGGQL